MSQKLPAAGSTGTKSTGQSSSSTSDSSFNEMVPIGIQSLITQTDASGRAIRPATPTYTDHSSSSSNSDRRQNRSGILQRWLCCFARVTGGGPTRNDGPPGASSRGGNSIGVVVSSGTKGAAQRNQAPAPPRGLPARRPVLGPANKGKKCLVLDLDETLVHSSFQKVSGAHMTIPVTIEDTVHNVFVIKRPGVDEFMRRMGQHFEIVIYTASLSKYADPLLDKLDIHKVINKRLFRENCVFYEGHYVKDLSLLERDITQTIIVDNSPPSYTFHPENAIDCSSFIDDPADVEMWQIGDFLEGIKDCEDVRKFCRSWKEWVSRNPTSVPLSMQTDATVTSTSPSPMAPVTLSS